LKNGQKPDVCIDKSSSFGTDFSLSEGEEKNCGKNDSSCESDGHNLFFQPKKNSDQEHDVVLLYK